MGSDGPSKEESAPANQDKEPDVDHEVSQVPPVEDMLLTCMNLLQNTDAVAFPLTDLLVTMCNRNKGQDRPQVISYLVRQLKSCKVEGSMTDTCPLSTISHTLALVLSEDSTAREIAAENGAVSIALDVLEQFRPVKTSLKNEIPKWLTALLLVLDHMLVCKLKITSDQPSGSATTAAASISMGVSSGTPAAAEQLSEAFNVQKESSASPFVSVLGKPSGYMSEDEQRRAMSVAAGFLQMQLPSATIQAVLQLCARLTKSYSIASAFFDSGELFIDKFISASRNLHFHVLACPCLTSLSVSCEVWHCALMFFDHFCAQGYDRKMFLYFRWFGCPFETSTELLISWI